MQKILFHIHTLPTDTHQTLTALDLTYVTRTVGVNSTEIPAGLRAAKQMQVVVPQLR